MKNLDLLAGLLDKIGIVGHAFILQKIPQFSYLFVEKIEVLIKESFVYLQLFLGFFQNLQLTFIVKDQNQVIVLLKHLNLDLFVVFLVLAHALQNVVTLLAQI